VIPLAYEPIESFTTSDHKPVRGAFYVTTNGTKSGRIVKASFGYRLRYGRLCKKRTTAKKLSLRKLSTEMRMDDIHLFVSDLKCFNIEKKWKDDKDRKYHITISSDPIGIISLKPKKINNSDAIRQKFNDNKGTISTTQIIQPEDENEMEWGDEEIQLEIKPDSDLTGALFYISLRSKKQVVGTIAMNLQNMVTPDDNSDLDVDDGIKQIDVDQNLLKNGIIRGQLKCSMLFWHLDSSPLLNGTFGIRKTSEKKKKNRLTHHMRKRQNISRHNKGGLSCFAKPRSAPEIL